MASRSMGDQGIRGFEPGMKADTYADWNAALARAKPGIAAVESRAAFVPAGKP